MGPFYTKVSIKTGAMNNILYGQNQSNPAMIHTFRRDASNIPYLKEFKQEQ